MAIFKPGSITQAVSGNVGGVNFAYSSRNIYVRTKRQPTSAGRIKQITNQAYFVEIGNAWTTLSTSLKNAWRTAAKNLPHKNRLGTPTTLSGREFFFQRNFSNLVTFQIAIENSPPMMQATGPLSGLSVENHAPGLYRFSIGTYPTLVTNPWVCWLSNQYTRTSLRHFKNPRIWLRGPNSVAASPCTNEIIAATGPLVVGQFLKFRALSRYQNQLDSPMLFATLTVTQP